MIQATDTNFFYFAEIGKIRFLWTKENKIGRDDLTLIPYKNFKTKNFRIDQK